MKNYLFKQWIAAFLVLFTVTNLNAQNFSAEQQRFEAMKAVELKIAQFIEEHENDELPQNVAEYIEKALRQDHTGHDHDEITPGQKMEVAARMKRMYFRNVYFKENPEEFNLFEPEAVADCINGDFETGDFTAYGAASGIRNGGQGDCNVAAIMFTAETPGTTEIGAGNGINCQIVGVGVDPIINTIQRVHSGSFAAQINQTSTQFGVNQITKRVVLTQPNENIAFWFSLVMQNPAGHPNAQPYFSARALTTGGLVLDQVCEFADANSAFFQSTVVNPHGLVVHAPYFCQTLEVSGNIGDTVVLEFSTSDCGAGAHWGYAYVDDICEECTVDSCNFQGSIDLNPTDTCSEITEICGTYSMAVSQCSTATVDNITLDIIQNGVVINTISGATIDPVNQTFCFPIAAGDFGGLTGGFDFQAKITFNINGQLNTVSDLNTNAGPDNDYVTDPDCCPEFRILDCCEYWDLAARGTQVDERIKEVVAKYKSDVEARYGVSADSIACDPCEYPAVAFPIFIVDEFNMLIDDSYYNISWSHHAGWTAAYDYINPNQQTIVTVDDPKSGCTWTDTFHLDCCKLDVEIVPLCTTCDPCANPGQPFFMVVEDQNGNPISTGYSFNWSTGSTASGINGTVNNQYWVEVKDLATGCISTDTFMIACCECEVKADFKVQVDKCDVRFTDISTTSSCTNIIGYKWDFGDGNTGTGANPTHTYSGNGSYSVCMEVLATNGVDTCRDRICYVVDIKDCEGCECGLKPDFKFETNGCDVRFDPSANPNSCTKVTGYFWDFGDGTTSTQQYPIHTYAFNGTYQVCLTVEGTDGTVKCKETICYTVKITDCKDCECEVKPDFRFNVEECSVKFEGDAGANACTQVLQYYWDFGDGNISHQQNPVHTYAANGSYQVCLTVEGTDGNTHCKNTICYTVDIRDCKGCDCKAEANFLGVFGIQDPCTVFFNDLSSTNECTRITDYKWDFGDGTTSALSNPSHTFPGDGIYQVCLTVIANNGLERCEHTFCKEIKIDGCRGIIKKGSTTSDELNDFGASIFPNPFSSNFSVQFTNPTEQNIEVSLLNSSGKQIALLMNENRAAGEHTLNFSANELQLAQGVYLVLIKSGDQLSYKKIIFEK